MYTLILLLCLIQGLLAGNILVLNPTVGHSHVRFLGNLANLLAEDGHNVTVLTASMDDSVEPFGTENPKIRKIYYESPYVDPKNWQKIDMKLPTFWNTPAPSGLSMDWTVWETFLETSANIYKGMLEDKVFIQSLKDEKFDIGILEVFEIGGIGILEVLGVRTTVAAAALGMLNYHYEMTGIPYFSSFVPDWMTTFGEEMSFLERLDNIRAEYSLNSYMRGHLSNLHSIFRKHDSNFPDLRELMKKNTGLVLVNTNEFAESPRPRSNMLQYVGGTNVHAPEPLPKNIEEMLEIRPNTVLFSMGSFVYSCSMPMEMKLEILNSFAQFPDHTFLWKYEDVCENDTTPFHDYPNVIAKKWWPQTDLLGHPKLKAFITHAGMNSMLEVAFRGKPAITIPLFADQYINAKNSVARGLSVMVDRIELSEKTLTKALHQILDPGSIIAKNAQMAADVLRGKDEEYRQSVLRWMKLLIQYGPMEHLRLPSRKMNYIQVFSLDCMLFVSFVILIVLLVKFHIIRSILRFIRRVQKEKCL